MQKLKFVSRFEARVDFGSVQRNFSLLVLNNRDDDFLKVAGVSIQLVYDGALKDDVMSARVDGLFLTLSFLCSISVSNQRSGSKGRDSF